LARVQRACEPRAPLPNHLAAGVLTLIDRLPPEDGLWHADLHPGNVTMTADGPRIIDWACALRAPAVCDTGRVHISPSGLIPEDADPERLRDSGRLSLAKGAPDPAQQSTYAQGLNFLVSRRSEGRVEATRQPSARVWNGSVIEVLLGTPDKRAASPELSRRQSRARCGHCMRRSVRDDMVNLPFQFFTNFPVLSLRLPSVTDLDLGIYPYVSGLMPVASTTPVCGNTKRGNLQTAFADLQHARAIPRYWHFANDATYVFRLAIEAVGPAVAQHRL
jgi:hypothetical protein